MDLPRSEQKIEILLRRARRVGTVALRHVLVDLLFTCLAEGDSVAIWIQSCHAHPKRIALWLRVSELDTQRSQHIEVLPKIIRLDNEGCGHKVRPHVGGDREGELLDIQFDQGHTNLRIRDADRVERDIDATRLSGIIFQHQNGRSALGPTTAHGHPVSNRDIPTSFVYGKRTRPSQTFAKGPFGLTGVVFKPQALGTLLNTHPVQLNNGPVELDEFSRENVGEQLLNARSQHERFLRLIEFLRAHVDGSGPEDVLVTDSLRLIHQGIRTIRVPQLLKCLNVSERQFERRFVRAIGVSPHHYIRIVRFQEAVRLIKTNQFERLSDVAYDLNYADQSHFIKEIKECSGYTPTGLVQTV